MSKKVNILVTQKSVMDVNNLGFTFRDYRILSYLLTEDSASTLRLREIRKAFNFNQNVFIHIFDSIEKMSEELNFNFPTWVIGAYYKNNIFMVDKNSWQNDIDDSFSSVLCHEFIHSATENYIGMCPALLNEGLAIHLSGQSHGMYLPSHMHIPENLYDIDYSHKDFYVLAGKCVEALFLKYGSEFVIDRIKHCKNYETDEFLNSKNIYRLISCMKEGI